MLRLLYVIEQLLDNGCVKIRYNANGKRKANKAPSFKWVKDDE